MFKYGSNFFKCTFKFLDCKSAAKDAEASPFPKAEVTPPVIKMYLVIYIKKKRQKCPFKKIKIN